MTGKKIEFLKKPNPTITDKFIDDWVMAGNKKPSEKKFLKRTTIYMPEELHKILKIKAANMNTTMTDLILEALETYVK